MMKRRAIAILLATSLLMSGLAMTAAAGEITDDITPEEGQPEEELEEAEPEEAKPDEELEEAEPEEAKPEEELEEAESEEAIFEIDEDSITADYGSYAPPLRESGKVTWTCFWYGSYPQAEVIPAEYAITLKEGCYEDGDYIIDNDLYWKFTYWSTEWVNDETTLYGERYRRVKRSDVPVDIFYQNDFKWGEDENEYHYFKYQPIKWRILSNTNDEALVIADKALEDRLFHGANISKPWAFADIRGFLGGDFLNTAFSAAEKQAIRPRSIANPANGVYGTAGTSNTTDRVFLLSETEAKTISYGFINDRNVNDKGRRCKSSTYAKAMGLLNFTENGGEFCYWWLRAPGKTANKAVCVLDSGEFFDNYDVNFQRIGVRPAMYIRLDIANPKPAGTVNTNYEVNEIAAKTSLKTAQVTLTPSRYNYDGKVKRPEVTVKLGSKTLTKDKDYIVVYDEMSGVGTGKLAVSGIGDYEGMHWKNYFVQYKDVVLGSYYDIPVEWAVTTGVTMGTSLSTFEPMKFCKRGEVVTFLWRANGTPMPTLKDCPFTDVPKSKYYYNAVLWAVEKGITTGTSPTTFSPEDNVSRGQFVSFLYREKGKPAVSGTCPFKDVPSDRYYCKPITWAAKTGVTTGTSPTTFSPEDPCTRGQVVTFIYRAKK